MKKGINTLIAIFSLCAAFGWWGVLYPQLTMTRDTYQILSEDGTVQESDDMVEWDFEGSVYRDILNTDISHIRFRSSFFKSIMEYLEYWKKE